MKFFFRVRKKTGNTELEETKTIRFLAGLFRVVLQWQKKAANSLQEKTERLSLRAKKIGLVILGLLFCSSCLFILYDTVLKGNKSKPPITSIQLPRYWNRTGEENLRPKIIVSEIEYKHIRRFREYIDSLENSAKGQQLRDSLLNGRPHLMDSLRYLEAIYQSQNLKTK